MTAAESAPIESREPHRRAVGLRADDERADRADVELVLRARDGDRSAFAELYGRYASSVHGICLATGPIEDANDLVQEVFLSALRAIDRLDDPRSLGAWLLTIARNRARDALRERGRAVPIDATAPPDEYAAPKSDAESDSDDEARGVLVAIQSLPESYRETLVLRLVEGLTGPEIADRTGLTHGSVRVNLHRGMKLLRERLERAGER